MRITTAREAAARLRAGMPVGDVFRPERRVVSIPDINAASGPVVAVHDRLGEAHAGLPVERPARQKKGRDHRSH